jgi:hypothetical protein
VYSEFTLIYKGARTVEPMALPARVMIRSILLSGFQFQASFDLFESLTLLVPGVDSSRVPGFFREFFYFLFCAIMAKLLEITPINHIYLER